MDRLTIQAEYYNVLKRVRKRSERAMVALAILEFAFDEIEPKDLTETAEIAFESMRQSLEKSRNNSGRGGRKKENRFETDLKPIENRNETELQPNENRFETDFFREKNTLSKKERSKEKNNLSPKKETPLFIPPQSGEKTKTSEDEFFEKYPRYAKDRSKMREDVDYKRLLEEFGKSSYLRSLYTVKQINDNYALIIQGDFRDKENPLAGFEARAERDRWYSERRAQAEREADVILKRFMQDEGFKAVHKRLKELECEIGKMEAKAESGDFKACKQLVKLTQEQIRRRMEYVGIIERNGKQEEDLYPKWHCPLCEDTGYLENGMACDCYEKEKEWKTC